MQSSALSWPDGPLAPKAISPWHSTKLITACLWGAGCRHDCSSLIRKPARKLLPVKLQGVRTTSSTTHAEAGFTCSPVRDSWKFSNRKIPTTITGLSGTPLHRRHKPSHLYRDGENFLRH